MLSAYASVEVSIHCAGVSISVLFLRTRLTTNAVRGSLSPDGARSGWFILLLFIRNETLN
jgi:hypothetical protein